MINLTLASGRATNSDVVRVEYVKPDTNPPVILINRDVEALRRTMIAFYRDYRPTAGRPLDIPTSESGVRVHNWKRYAVLDTATGVDGWRINNDGSLRRLVRWPREIDPKGQRQAVECSRCRN